jgi:hypothetical protein
LEEEYDNLMNVEVEVSLEVVKALRIVLTDVVICIIFI